MKLTAKIKLQPTPDQYALLLNTLETANAACNDISQQAWSSGVFSQFSLHKLVYHDIRDRFPLSAQMVVRAVAKVADAYRLDKKAQRTFKPHGAFPYDSRILSFQTAEQTVSIWTLAGRQRIPYQCGDRQRDLLEGDRGEADLCLIDTVFYLFVVCEVETPEPEDVDEFLGVDLGVVNIATDNDGTTHSGSTVNNVRHRHRRLRAKLQRKGTKSAKRRLRKLAGQERRFAAHTNHTISKRIVAAAQDTGRGIALEDLKGIRDRVTVRRSQRATLHSWSFFQLRQFIEYKAQRVGVRVVAVDPRHTSRTCPACGCVDQRNRPNQAAFSCIRCGFSGPADYIAAGNIASRAAVSLPHVSDAPSAA